MSQQIINLGVGPDSQTGDSLYVAFNKVNNNFTELYSVFDGNGITTINANVIYSNNIVTSVNVRTGNLFAYGNIESLGYVVTSGIFYPNGSPIGSLASLDSNLIPLTSNIYTVGNVTNQFTQGYFSSNITLAGSNVTVRNGVLYIDGDLAESNYSNANVANYLPVYGGNIDATVITSSQPYITELGTLTSLNVDGNTVISGNLDVSGTITYLNVRDFSVQDPIITLNTGVNGSPLLSNNSFDSGVRTYYYDGENRAAFFGRANDTGYFEYYSNVISEIGNIITGTYGTVKSGNLVLTNEANISGNVFGNYFLGNGRYLSGIDATLIGNGTSNVKVYANGNIAISSAGVSNVATFTSIGGNVTGDFFITGTIKALNYIGNVQGNLSAPGINTQVLFNDNDTAGAASGLTFNKTSNVLTVAGNIVTSGNIVVAGYDVIDSTGNIVTSQLVNSGVTAGTYGNASAVPVITVDSKGRITLANTTAVAGVNNVTYDTATSNLTVFTSAGTNFSVDVGVGTSDSPVFAGLSVSGNSTVNGLTVNNSTTIGSTLGVTGNLVAANLTTSGKVNAGQVDVAGYNVIDSTGNVVTSQLIDSGVTPGVYGNASAVPVITIDSKGRITLANTTAVAGVNNVTYDAATSNLTVFTSAGTNFSVDVGVGTSDSPVFAGLSVAGNSTVNALTVNNSTTIGSTLGVTGNLVAANLNTSGKVNAGQVDVAGYNVIDSTGNVVTSQLIDSGVAAGTYGNASAVPVITVDSKGRITVANTTAVAGVNNVTYDAATGNLTVFTSAGTNFSIDTNVGTSDSPVFAGLSVSGNSTVNALTVNNSTTIGSTLGVTGNVTAPWFLGNVTGNITAPGTTWQVLFNDGNVISADPGLTFNGTQDLLTVAGNVQANAITTNSDITVGQSIRVTGRVYVDVPQGNAPFAVASSTVTPNLNADLLDGYHANVGAVIDTIVLRDPVGNLVANGIQIFGSGSFSNALSAWGGLQNTVIGNIMPSTGYFTIVDAHTSATVNELTVNNGANIGSTLGVTGNINGSSITLSGRGSIAGNLSAAGGLQATTIGNVVPSSAIFTNESVSGNSTVNALTVNNSATVGGSFGVTGNIVSGNVSTTNLVVTGIIAGNITVSNVSLSGGLQNTPVGNAIASTGQFTTLIANTSATLQSLTVNSAATIGTTLVAGGNVTANGLTVNNSVTVGTTLGVTGNVIAAGLTSTGSITAGSTLSAAVGIENTAIGATTPRPAQFTTANASGNVIASGLTVNNSGTFGTTLGVAGNATVGNLSTAGIVTITNTTQATGTGTGALTVYGGASVTKDMWVGGNLYTSNLIATTTSNITVQDPLLYLTANTPYPYSYEIGFYSQFNPTGSDYQHTGLIRNHVNNTWYLVSNVAEPTGSTVDLADANVVYDSIRIGSTTIYGAIAGTSTLNVAGTATVGNLVSNGTISGGAINFANAVIASNLIANGITVNTSLTAGTTLSALGGLQATPIGNVNPSTAIFTTASVSGNATVNALTVNNSTTIGSTLGVTGNITGSSATLSGSATIGSTLGVTGNITGSGATLSSSATVGGTLGVTGNITGSGATLSGALVTTGPAQHLGGLQATPIGNVNPSTAIFTSESVSGNSTVNALTVNISATIGSTLGVTGNINGSSATLSGSLVTTGPAQHLGGLQATPIGNTTASSGQFTTVSATGNITGAALTSNGSITAQSTISALGGIQNTPIGNVTTSTALFTTVGASGNTTVSALTVNNSATIGGTLGVTGNTIVGNLTTQSITISATTPATSNVTGAVIVSGGIGVGGNVYVGQRVGFVAANSVSAVYQIYNSSTNSLDTVFG